MKWFLISVFALLMNISFSQNDSFTEELDKGNDPNFSIVHHADTGFSNFNRKVVVFGIDIYAVAAVENSKLLHAANVMAQYLDNNEDGVVDDQLVLTKMHEKCSFMVMWKSEKDLDLDLSKEREGQDLGNDETNPNYVSNGRKGEFDATLEEVLHLINNAGHSNAYPREFGQYAGSELSNAMDIARGGKFMSIPSKYPENAWYTYYDQTCDYSDCQTLEYLYWALTSILGAQQNRLEEIDHEWKLNTFQKVKNNDPKIFDLITNPVYKLPTILPDGTYMH